MIGPISRRGFLAGAAGVVLGACTGNDGDADADAPVTTPSPATTGPTTAPATTTTTTPLLTADPFTLGVASGDPVADSVVLWTRLVPAGEPPSGDVELRVEVARDAAFTGTLDTRTVTAVAEDGHAVHAVIDGLEPAAEYWYRFTVAGFTSAVGRTRTTPADLDATAGSTFGSASCQNYEDGWYVAHRDIAASDLDALVWLGDYIYEGAGQPVGPAGVRTHGAPEAMTLDDYRARYALYKADPDLQAAHASCPWIVIWDDHEVENNYAGGAPPDLAEAGDAFRTRRTAAYRAWWEHMPVRLPRPDGADYRIYRSHRFGDLLELSLLDTRQYRADQACGDIGLSLDPPCAEAFDPARTMLGEEQEAWLLERLQAPTTRWNVVAQQVIFGNTTLNGAILNYDQWDGYPVARDRLLQAITDAAVPNVVVLTGDIHLAAVGNLRAPGGGPVVGAELVATSISSGGNVDPALAPILTAIPDVVDAELVHRGWIRHTVTRERWSAEYRIVDDARLPDSGVSTYGTYEIVAGTPGATRVA